METEKRILSNSVLRTGSFKNCFEMEEALGLDELTTKPT